MTMVLVPVTKTTRKRMQLFEGCTNLAKKGKECILYLTRGAKVQGETVQALEGVYRPSQEMGGNCESCMGSKGLAMKFFRGMNPMVFI